MPDVKRSVIQKASELVEFVLNEMNFELVDLEYVSERGKWILRIYMDRRGSGVTLDDCVRVSREVGDLIEVKDIIPHEYVLEVSSPGLNRPLKKDRDFTWAMGKKIKLKTKVPVEGQRNFTGHLEDFQEGTLCLRTEGRVVSISIADVEKANLVYEF